MMLAEDPSTASLDASSASKSPLHNLTADDSDDPGGVPEEILTCPNPKVSLGVRVWRVKMVDHVDGSFFVRLSLYFSWVDPKNVGIKKGTYVGHPIASHASDGIKSHFSIDIGGSAASSSSTCTECYSPTPRFENSSNVEFDKDQALTPITVDDRGLTKLGITLSGIFWTDFDMREFPLDLQTLCVKIRFPHAKDRCRVDTSSMEEEGSVNPVKNCVVVDDSFSMIDFHLRQPFIDIEYPCMVKHGLKQSPKPQWVIKIPIQRVYEHYFHHIVAVAFLLSSFNFTVFLIDPEDLASRLSIIFTLLLTIIATKFLTIQSLPKMPYATLLDDYFHQTVVFFVLYVVLCCVTAAIGKQHASSTIGNCDIAFHIALLVFWIVVNAQCIWGGAKILRRHDSSNRPIILRAGSFKRN